MTGACRYCGQIQQIETEETSEHILDRMASENCDCKMAERRRELKAVKIIAEKKVIEICEEQYGEMAELLIQFTHKVLEGKIKSGTFKMDDQTTIKIAKSTKAFVKIEKVEKTTKASEI